MDIPVLELYDISKKIKKKQIVKNINLIVNRGEIFGFLGPNGAGKTTTIRMIVGLIKPNSGSIKICGVSLSEYFNIAMSHVGCIIESPELYKYLTGMENLMQFAAMDKRITMDRINKAIEMVGLQNRIHDKVRTYSLGMRQRLGIAQAILNNPKLLILDEPTNGLDPAGIAEFRQLLRTLAYEEGMAVFVSSHLLAEVQQICDTVSIISNGNVIKSLKVSEIENEKIIEWQVDEPLKAIEILKKNWNIDGMQLKKNTLKATVAQISTEDINEIFIQEGLKLSFCTEQKSSLEDLFLTLTEGDEIV